MLKANFKKALAHAEFISVWLCRKLKTYRHSLEYKTITQQPVEEEWYRVTAPDS
jgi:hypothetical protein